MATWEATHGTGYKGKKKRPPRSFAASPPSKGPHSYGGHALPAGKTYAPFRNSPDSYTPRQAAASVRSSVSRPPVSHESVLTDLASLVAPSPTPREIAQSAHTLGVKAKALSSDAASEAASAAQKVVDTAAAVAKLPQQRVHDFLGVRTLGAPTIAQIVKAGAHDVRHPDAKPMLRHNRRGKLTVPVTRQAARSLKRAKAKAAHARGGVRGPLTPGEKVFVTHLAKLTGLSPLTLAAWTQQEGGNSFGDYNRLNIGQTDSGPIGVAYAGGWSNPKSAAALTAAFLKGEWGGASPSIRSILPRARGKSPVQQLSIIASTDWAGDPAYREHLLGVLPQFSQAPANPRALKQLRAAQTRARALGISTKGGPRGIPREAFRNRYPPGTMVHLVGVPGGAEADSALNAEFAPLFAAWAKKYGIELHAAYDPGGGHVSPGHNISGTATDIGPVGDQWTGRPYERFVKGIELLVANGFEVLYDGSIPGTIPYQNHGRYNHAHVEWVGNGTAADARRKLRGMLVSGKLPVPAVSASTLAGGVTATGVPLSAAAGVAVSGGRPARQALPYAFDPSTATGAALAATAPLPEFYSGRGSTQAQGAAPSRRSVIREILRRRGA